MSSVEKPTVLLVPGSWNKPECMFPLRDELMPVLPVEILELPTTEPGITMEEHSFLAETAMKRLGRVIVIDHSWGVNATMRAAEALETNDLADEIIQHMIHINGAFFESTLDPLLSADQNVPRRNTRLSQRAIIQRPDLGECMTSINRSKAPKVFANGNHNKDSVDGLMECLQPQYRPDEKHELTLSAWSKVPQTMVISSHDKIVRPKFLEFVASIMPDAEIVRWPGNHSPHWFRPKKVARLAIERAQRLTV